MASRRWRVLLVSSHPVPNAEPVLRELARRPCLEITVAYCSLPDETLWSSPEYLTKTAFDVPLLEGYPWVVVPNRAPTPTLASFTGLFNPGIARLVPRYDCCIVYGYAYASLALTIAMAKITRTPVIVTTDATYLESSDGRAWKVPVKRCVLPTLLRIPEMLLTPSTAGMSFLHSIGIARERVVMTAYVVDNDAMSARAERADVPAVRADWGIPADAPVALFCAKFITRKRPHDALCAFAQADVPGSFLVMAGDGPLRPEVQAAAGALGIADRVRFLGMVRYSELPEVYAASTVLVVPSDHEPWGLTVNEAMLSGTPVIASDRVGARLDLIEGGRTGYVYPSGDVGALASVLRRLLAEPQRAADMGRWARRRMDTWSPRENADGVVRAVELAVQRRRGLR